MHASRLSSIPVQANTHSPRVLITPRRHHHAPVALIPTTRPHLICGCLLIDWRILNSSTRLLLSTKRWYPTLPPDQCCFSSCDRSLRKSRSHGIHDGAVCHLSKIRGRGTMCWAPAFTELLGMVFQG